MPKSHPEYERGFTDGFNSAESDREKLRDLQRAVRRALRNNAGPTSTDEGTNTHVLIRRVDFNALQKVINHV